MGSTWALGLLLMRSHTDKETGSESPCQPLLSPAGLWPVSREGGAGGDSDIYLRLSGCNNPSGCKDFL